MTLNGLEKLTANIVFVPSDNAVFAEQTPLTEMQELLDDPTIQSTIAPNTLQFVSARQQLVIAISSANIAIQDQSSAIPPRDNFITTALKIADLFISQESPRRFKAYGFNFDVALDSPPETKALGVISERLLKPDLFGGMAGIDLWGATTKLYFQWDDARCQLSLEPRWGRTDTNRLFAHVNFHYELEDSDLPDEAALEDRARNCWSNLLQVLEKLIG